MTTETVTKFESQPSPAAKPGWIDYAAIEAAKKARKAKNYAAADESASEIVAVASEHGFTVEREAYVWTFRRGRLVFQWWPAQGRTMINYVKHGPNCDIPRLLGFLRSEYKAPAGKGQNKEAGIAFLRTLVEQGKLSPERAAELVG